MYYTLFKESKLLVVILVLKLSDEPLIISKNREARYRIVHKMQTIDRQPPIIEPWSSVKRLWLVYLLREVVKFWTGVEKRSSFFRNLNEAMIENLNLSYYIIIIIQNSIIKFIIIKGSLTNYQKNVFIL